MALRIASVDFDCHDVQRLQSFWSAALGYRVSGTGGGDTGGVEDPDDRDVELVFVRVPEEKAVKNRVHLDLGADDREAEVQRLLALGARRVADHGSWTVMQDPEGNEFCVVQAPPEDPVSGWRR